MTTYSASACTSQPGLRPAAAGEVWVTDAVCSAVLGGPHRFDDEATTS